MRSEQLGRTIFHQYSHSFLWTVIFSKSISIPFSNPLHVILDQRLDSSRSFNFFITCIVIKLASNISSDNFNELRACGSSQRSLRSTLLKFALRGFGFHARPNYKLIILKNHLSNMYFNRLHCFFFESVFKHIDFSLCFIRIFLVKREFIIKPLLLLLHIRHQHSALKRFFNELLLEVIRYPLF